MTMLSSAKIGAGNALSLSNNNLTVTGTSNGGVATIDSPLDVNKSIYFEVNIEVGGTLEIGVIDSDFAPFSARYLEYESSGKSRFYCSWNGSKGTQDGETSYGPTYTTGDSIGVGINMVNHTITFFKNGVNLGVAYSDLDTLNKVYPAISFDGGGKVTFNFGASDFKYSLPNGYDTLDKPWYYGKIKNKIEDVKNIGDCILCKYAAPTSGQVGSFSEIGTTVAPLIPPISSATPDGSFYWIYVGKDYLGRKKFIADRNIQHSINWDTLNSSGICSEKIIDLGLGRSLNTSIKLLTGGVNANDTENEWDKFIVNSSLGGSITSGDANVWNWVNMYSWTSSTSTDSSYRSMRGYSTKNTFADYLPNALSSAVGFRPVMLVEQLNTNKFLLKKDGNYYSIDAKYYDELKHEFAPLTLNGGADPNQIDIENFGFESLSNLITTMTKGSDTFKPCSKIKNCEIKCYTKK